MIETAKETSAELGKLDGLTQEEADNIARIVGLGALKYFIETNSHHLIRFIESGIYPVIHLLPQGKGLVHFSYGMVELPEGKMKSREGTVVDADDLMEAMIESTWK